MIPVKYNQLVEVLITVVLVAWLISVAAAVIGLWWDALRERRRRDRW